MDVIKGSMCSLFAFVELHSTRFSKYTGFTKLQLFEFVSSKQILFPQFDQTPFTDMANLMCQISLFDKGFADATFVEPLITSTSRVYKPCFLTPLNTSFEPFITLRYFSLIEKHILSYQIH